MAKVDEIVSGWCAKCKKNSQMKTYVKETSSRNMVMAKGKCSVCGTNMCRILGKAEAK